MSCTYRIDGIFAETKYQGPGHAVAAVEKNKIVDLLYLRNVVKDVDENSEAAILAALADNRLERKVRQMRELGEVFFGLCSTYEFNVL